MDAYQVYTITITVIGISATLVMIFFILSIQKALNKFTRNSLDLARNYELLKSNLEKQLLEVEVESQENTFQFISKEIHDNISQNLSLAVINLNCYIDTLRKDDSSNIKLFVAQIKKALEDLNNLSKSLDSDLIETHGLATACQFECDRWNRLFSTEVNFEVIGESIHLNKTLELFIMRIIQESLSNAIKYSKASLIKIALTYRTDQVVACIEDNGVGFNLKEVLESKIAGKRSGIRNMKQRAQMLNGNFEISTGLGQGTKVSVTINTMQDEKNNGWAGRRSQAAPVRFSVND